VKAVYAQSSACIEPYLTVVLLALVSLCYRWSAEWWSRSGGPVISICLHIELGHALKSWHLD